VFKNQTGCVFWLFSLFFARFDLAYGFNVCRDQIMQNLIKNSSKITLPLYF